MDFSEKLKQIRKNEGLSQEQLAEKIGVSRQAITKWETGKGLPDIENITILSELFKTTIDELISETASMQARTKLFKSETIYDIDCEKHFDINIGSANSILLTSGSNEKLHICLKSETIENISSIFKIRLDEKRSSLDVVCINKDKISRYEAEAGLFIEITLPEKYSDHCEIAASVKQLYIRDLSLRRLEYDGDAESVHITNSCGSLEFTSKTDYDITIDKISGCLDVNQWKSKTMVHILESKCPKVLNKGRKCSVFFIKNGENCPSYDFNDTENVLSISGIFSELTVDLI